MSWNRIQKCASLARNQLVALCSGNFPKKLM